MSEARKKPSVDAYNCHKCHTRHAVDNMVAYCASCFSESRQSLTEPTGEGDVDEALAWVDRNQDNPLACDHKPMLEVLARYSRKLKREVAAAREALVFVQRLTQEAQDCADEQRLDWAQSNGADFGQDLGGLWWSLPVMDPSGKYAQRYPSLRQAIDAAIRAKRPAHPQPRKEKSR